MTNKSIVATVLVVVGVFAVPIYLKSKNNPTPIAPEGVRSSPLATGASATTKSLPRFVDFGTTTCIPCKVMLGVMAELEQKYPGAMTIEFVNVQTQQDKTQLYGVRTIPTQIFFSPNGQELFRHLGVIKTEDVIAKWAELGFAIQPTAGK